MCEATDEEIKEFFASTIFEGIYSTEIKSSKTDYFKGHIHSIKINGEHNNVLGTRINVPVSANDIPEGPCTFKCRVKEEVRKTPNQINFSVSPKTLRSKLTSSGFVETKDEKMFKEEIKNMETTVSHVDNNSYMNNNGNSCSYLCFYPNGSYVISDSKKNDGILLNGNVLDSFLLQCYDNGYVNKVPIENIMNLRRDFEYSNGVYKSANIQNNLVLGSNDYLVVKYTSVEGVKCRFVKASSIVKTHTILGLKGLPLITDVKNAKISWHSMQLTTTNAISPAILKLVMDESTLLLDEKHIGIAKWLDSNVFADNNKNPVGVSFENEIMTFVINGEYDKVKEVFNKYTTGSNIIAGQSLAKSVVLYSRTKDTLWTLIKLLIECNAGIYIKPIIDAISEDKFLQTIKPDEQLFESILEFLFAQESKFHHTLSLVCPYRDCLSKRMKIVIGENSDKLPNNPEYYNKFARILNLSFDEEVKIIIKNATHASYYHLYEILSQYKQNHSAAKAKLLSENIISKITDVSYQADLIKKLIEYDICGSKFGKYDSMLLQSIVSEGFDKYYKECVGKNNKIKSQEQIRCAHKHIGEYRTCIVKKEYQNHYGLTSLEGMGVIMPKKFCNEQLRINKSIKVQIVHVDTNNHVMYVSEFENVTSKEILEIPLLNIGDKIEVSFYKRNPKAHGCHGLVNVLIAHSPKYIDFKKRYEAQVTSRKDQFTYEVKIIKQIDN